MGVILDKIYILCQYCLLFGFGCDKINRLNNRRYVMFKVKKEKSKVEVELTVDAKEWEEGVQKVYETSKAKFNVEGFRKGHAPRRVIEKTYGDSIFFEDTVEYFVNKTLSEVISKNPELEPVAMPTTKFESFTVEAGLKMKIIFEIVPDFTLCEYKGQTFKVHDSKVTDHDIEHAIHHLLEDHAKFESVDRAVKVGDSVLIDFTGYMDNVAFDGGAGQDYPLEIGSHTFIDTFEDQLVGHKKGDVVDVNVTFPENYQAEEFQGKKALFKVGIKDVREKVVPELTDKFIADTTEFETIEEYKKDVTAHIQDMKTKQQENEIQYVIRDYLLKNTNVEIPEVMVEDSVHAELHRLTDALKAYNVSVEDYLLQTGSNMEDYLKNSRMRTLEMLKIRYIYRKLLDESKIDLTAKEIKDAHKGAKDENEVVKRENDLLLDKLYAFLKENNKIEIIK